MRQQELLSGTEREAGCLFAVSERGIEDPYLSLFHRILLPSTRRPRGVRLQPDTLLRGVRLQPDTLLRGVRLQPDTLLRGVRLQPDQNTFVAVCFIQTRIAATPRPWPSPPIPVDATRQDNVKMIIILFELSVIMP